MFIYERTCSALVFLIHADDVRIEWTGRGLKITVIDMQSTVATGIYVAEHKRWHHHYSIECSALWTVIKWMMWIWELRGVAIETLSLMQIIWQRGFSYMKVDIWRHGSLITSLYWLRCQSKNNHRTLQRWELLVTCVLNHAFDAVFNVTCHGEYSQTVLSEYRKSQNLYITDLLWNYVLFRTRIHMDVD